jgi:hypothetical protein
MAAIELCSAEKLVLAARITLLWERASWPDPGEAMMVARACSGTRVYRIRRSAGDIVSLPDRPDIKFLW